MTIIVTCDCGKRMKANDKLAGKRVRCPECKEPVSIPQAASSQAASSQAGKQRIPTSPPASSLPKAQCACGQIIAYNPANAGKAGQCPGCGQGFLIPGDDEGVVEGESVADENPFDLDPLSTDPFGFDSPGFDSSGDGSMEVGFPSADPLGTTVSNDIVEAAPVEQLYDDFDAAQYHQATHQGYTPKPHVLPPVSQPQSAEQYQEPRRRMNVPFWVLPAGCLVVSLVLYGIGMLVVETGGATGPNTGRLIVAGVTLVALAVNAVCYISFIGMLAEDGADPGTIFILTKFLAIPGMVFGALFIWGVRPGSNTAMMWPVSVLISLIGVGLVALIQSQHPFH